MLSEAGLVDLPPAAAGAGDVADAAGGAAVRRDAWLAAGSDGLFCTPDLLTAPFFTSDFTDEGGGSGSVVLSLAAAPEEAARFFARPEDAASLGPLRLRPATGSSCVCSSFNVWHFGHLIWKRTGFLL